jgi:hypothetical protein
MQVIHYASLYKAQNGRTLKRKSKSAQQRGWFSWIGKNGIIPRNDLKSQLKFQSTAVTR